MELTEMTIPDLVKKLKTLGINNFFRNIYRGEYYIPENYRKILIDIYEDKLLLNKDTISLYLIEEGQYTYEDSEYKDKGFREEELLEKLFRSLNINDVIKLTAFIRIDTGENLIPTAEG